MVWLSELLPKALRGRVTDFCSAFQQIAVWDWLQVRAWVPEQIMTISLRNMHMRLFVSLVWDVSG